MAHSGYVFKRRHLSKFSIFQQSNVWYCDIGLGFGISLWSWKRYTWEIEVEIFRGCLLQVTYDSFLHPTQNLDVSSPYSATELFESHQSRLLTSILNVCMSYGSITNGLQPVKRQEKKGLKNIMENGCKSKLHCCPVEWMGENRGQHSYRLLYIAELCVCPKPFAQKKSKWNIPFD